MEEKNTMELLNNQEFQIEIPQTEIMVVPAEDVSLIDEVEMSKIEPMDEVVVPVDEVAETEEVVSVRDDKTLGVKEIPEETPITPKNLSVEEVVVKQHIDKESVPEILTVAETIPKVEMMAEVALDEIMMTEVAPENVTIKPVELVTTDVSSEEFAVAETVAEIIEVAETVAEIIQVAETVSGTVEVTETVLEAIEVTDMVPEVVAVEEVLSVSEVTPEEENTQLVEKSPNKNELNPKIDDNETEIEIKLEIFNEINVAPVSTDQIVTEESSPHNANSQNTEQNNIMTIKQEINDENHKEPNSITENEMSIKTEEIDEISIDKDQPPPVAAEVEINPENPLTIKLQYQCSRCNDQFQTSRQLTNHSKYTCTESPKYVCNQCKKVFCTIRGMLDHLHVHITSEIKICPYCLVAFREDSFLELHIKKIHGVNKLNAFLNQKLYRCTACDKMYPHLYSLQRHFSMVHQQTKHECRVCKKLFLNRHLVMKHMRDYHANEKRYQCEHCLDLFAEKDKYLEHIKSDIHADDRFQCDHCKRKFPSSEKLAKHKLGHIAEVQQLNNTTGATATVQIKEEPMEDKKEEAMESTVTVSAATTTTTDNKAPTVDAVVVVKKKKPAVKKLRCDICNKNYQTTLALKKHRLYYHSNQSANRPFKCDLCLYSARLKSHLKIHHDKHFNECSPLFISSIQKLMTTEFKCDLCPKIFSTSSNLSRHRLFHTKNGNLPYLCDKCSYTGLTKMALTKHRKKYHLNNDQDAPFKCDICPKRFTSKINMSRHRIYHPEGRQLYQCNECQHTCVSEINLNKHKLTHLSSEVANSTTIPVTTTTIDNENPLDSSSQIKCNDCMETFVTATELTKHRITIHLSKSSPPKETQKMIRMTYLKTPTILNASTSAVQTTEETIMPTTTTTLIQPLPQEQKPLPIEMSEKNTQINDNIQLNKQISTNKTLNQLQQTIVTNFQCIVCTKYFSNARNLYNHQAALHFVSTLMALSDNKSGPLIIRPTPWQCTFCTKYLSSKMILNRHLDKHKEIEAKNSGAVVTAPLPPPPPPPPPEMVITEASTEEVVVVAAAATTTEAPMTITIKTELEETRTALDSPKPQSIISAPPVVPTLSSPSAPPPSKVIKQPPQPRPATPFQCYICLKYLASKFNLRIHKQKYHGIFEGPVKKMPPIVSNLKCEICSKRFLSKKIYLLHKQHHANQSQSNVVLPNNPTDVIPPTENLIKLEEFNEIELTLNTENLVKLEKQEFCNNETEDNKQSHNLNIPGELIDEHICDICHEKFTTNQQLFDHKIKHTKEILNGILVKDLSMPPLDVPQMQPIKLETTQQLQPPTLEALLLQQMKPPPPLVLPPLAPLSNNTQPLPIIDSQVTPKPPAELTTDTIETPNLPKKRKRKPPKQSPTPQIKRKRKPKLKNESTNNVVTSSTPPPPAEHPEEPFIIKPYKCSACPLLFETIDYESAHFYFYHSDESPLHIKSFKKRVDNPWICKFCNKQFDVQKKFENHTRVHTGERKYECEICGKTFILESSIKLHSTMHQENRFKCTKCPKEYSQRKTLRLHMQLHDHPQLSRCPICDKEYSAKISLKHHIDTVHGDKGKKKINRKKNSKKLIPLSTTATITTTTTATPIDQQEQQQLLKTESTDVVDNQMLTLPTTIEQMPNNENESLIEIIPVNVVTMNSSSGSSNEFLNISRNEYGLADGLKYENSIIQYDPQNLVYTMSQPQDECEIVTECVVTEEDEPLTVNNEIIVKIDSF